MTWPIKQKVFYKYDGYYSYYQIVTASGRSVVKSGPAVIPSILMMHVLISQARVIVKIQLITVFFKDFKDIGISKRES
jgi:hypothetical protein